MLVNEFHKLKKKQRKEKHNKQCFNKNSFNPFFFKFILKVSGISS